MVNKKEQPVLSQKFIDNGICPFFVTIYNESDQTIKIMKNAVGGISMLKSNDVAELYLHSMLGKVIKKIVSVTSILLLAVDLLSANIKSNSNLKNYLNSWSDLCHMKTKYELPILLGLCSGFMEALAMVKLNFAIQQAFKSKMLAEVSYIDPGCSMNFLLFTNQALSGHTLKVPIFDRNDNQVVSFGYAFDSVN